MRELEEPEHGLWTTFRQPLSELGAQIGTRMTVMRLDRAVGARLVVEALVFWAVHRHGDPSPQTFAEPVVKGTVTRFLAAALVDDGGRR